MLRALKQLRTAASLLDPNQVRRAAERPVSIELFSPDPRGYAEIEDFLIPGQVSHADRGRLMEFIYRTGDPAAPDQFDLTLAQGPEAPSGAFAFDPQNPAPTIDAILRHVDEDLALALARQFPAFRQPAVDRIVNSISRENAMFALATALPNIVPSLIELPWAVGEFASDTALLTMNQVRMAFLIAAANGRPVGLSEQKTEVLSIAAGAFGWRAIARELAGKIPFGGGLIAKGAIAYAGTFVIGKGLSHFNSTGSKPGRNESKAMYDDAYARGRQIAEGLRKELL
jgi:uncharacterized protein (DUF697 family)